jgi:sugar (pentulose or hexulose) kinase
MATDSTSGTILLVDPSGAALTPGLMYDDARAGGQAERANGAAEEVLQRLGYRVQPSWGLPKLLWLLDSGTDPPAGARLAHQCDYVNRRLLGCEPATDWSHALKSGYDPGECSWPLAVLERLGVREDLLPEVVRPGTLLGEVCEEGARETGVPIGTHVRAGMTDGCAAQIAAGALADGSWSSALGTTLALKGSSARLVRDPNGVLYCHRSPDGGWLPGGATSAGAAVLSEGFPDRDLDELAERAERHEGTDVLAYPLAGKGERFPFEAPEAEGFLLGRPGDDGEHFAALLQGLAFLERLCFDYVDMLGAPIGGEVSLTGGATRGRYLSQLRADVLGRPLRLLESADPATGMAVLASAGERSVADAAAGMVRVRRLVEPREGRATPLLERYLRLVAELEERGWLGRDLADHARSRAG